MFRKFNQPLAFTARFACHGGRSGLLGRRDEAIEVWTDAVQRNPRLALVNNELAGAKQSLGKFDEANRN
jgi:hypothetical protein